MVAEHDAGCRTDDRAGVQLTFAADVEQLHPERDCSRETGEEKRSRRDERRVERVAPEEGAVEQLAEGMARRVVRREQHDSHHHERNDERAQRHDEREPPRLLQPALDADHWDSPPAISNPSSSTEAVLPSTSPTIAPS